MKRKAFILLSFLAEFSFGQIHSSDIYLNDRLIVDPQYKNIVSRKKKSVLDTILYYVQFACPPRSWNEQYYKKEFIVKIENKKMTITVSLADNQASEAFRIPRELMSAVMEKLKISYDFVIYVPLRLYTFAPGELDKPGWVNILGFYPEVEIPDIKYNKGLH